MRCLKRQHRLWLWCLFVPAATHAFCSLHLRLLLEIQLAPAPLGAGSEPQTDTGVVSMVRSPCVRLLLKLNLPNAWIHCDIRVMSPSSIPDENRYFWILR